MASRQEPVCLAKSIHHIGIAVKDLEANIALYGEIFGTTLVKTEEIGDVRAVLLPVGGSHVEFIASTSPDSVVARFIERRGEGLHHVCFEVSGIQEKLKVLEARGIGLVDRVPRPGIAGMIAFLHPGSFNGVLVELVEVE